jgi:hypothetical protein
MADLACWVGWPPSEMYDMSLEDLADWHDRIRRRMGGRQ